MTAVLQPALAAPSNLHPGTDILTVTTRSVPPGVVVAAVCGEVDQETAPLLKNRLLAHLRPTGPPLVVDLTEVSFLGAAGLTVLIEAREAAVAEKIRLCVVARSRRVLRPLAITGLDRVFDVRADLAQALLCVGVRAEGRPTS